jgi:hypothetical protein
MAACAMKCPRCGGTALSQNHRISSSAIAVGNCNRQGICTPNATSVTPSYGSGRCLANVRNARPKQCRLDSRERVLLLGY